MLQFGQVRISQNDQEFIQSVHAGVIIISQQYNIHKRYQVKIANVTGAVYIWRKDSYFLENWFLKQHKWTVGVGPLTKCCNAGRQQQL